MTDLMKGKRGLVMGVANDRSIAWGIAKALHAEGPSLPFLPGRGLRQTGGAARRLARLDALVDVDVTDDASMDAVSRRSPRPGAVSISSSMPLRFPTRRN
jgi:enoyl-[acyl-carrier protein] reductase I